MEASTLDGGDPENGSADNIQACFVISFVDWPVYCHHEILSPCPGVAFIVDVILIFLLWIMQILGIMLLFHQKGQE